MHKGGDDSPWRRDAVSGRHKFSDLREAFLNDPERGAERREEVE